MQCEEVRDQLADSLIENVEDSVGSRIRQHLLTCESCRTEADGLRTIWANLKTIPAADPGPDARSRFEVMLEAYRQGLESRDVTARLRGWWPLKPVWQFGLALGLLVLGMAAGQRMRLDPNPQLGQEITDLRGELRQMRQMVALSLMQQESASDRLKGVSWSYQLQQPGAAVLAALLDTLMHDPNVNVRLAAVDALRQFGGQPVVRRGVVEALTQQQSPMVQIALIDLVVDLREKESVETLRQLSQNQTLNTAVRERAQERLTELE